MVFDLFFRVGPAIQAIFELGYEPKEAFFFELNEKQYQEIAQEGRDMSQKWFGLIPANPRYDTPELLIFTEYEKHALLDAVAYINRLCDKSEQEFDGFQDKLKYAASVLPKVFSGATKYDKKPKTSHLRVVK